jgi:hypothetical protein
VSFLLDSFGVVRWIWAALAAIDVSDLVTQSVRGAYSNTGGLHHLCCLIGPGHVGVLFTYYLRTLQTLMKLVAQIQFTSLLGIRLLCYLGASGLM